MAPYFFSIVALLSVPIIAQKIASHPVRNTTLGSNTAASFAVSAPCQNARDATIAGTAVAHQLLTSAMQTSPNKNITSQVNKAQNSLNKALGFAGSLAMTASVGSTIGQSGDLVGDDLELLDKVLNDALRNVNSAVTSVRQLGKVAVSTNQTVGLQKSFAIFGVDGVEILNESAANVMNAAESKLSQASLQIQSAIQAVLFSSSCVTFTNANPGNSHVHNSTARANTTSNVSNAAKKPSSSSSVIVYQIAHSTPAPVRSPASRWKGWKGHVGR